MFKIQELSANSLSDFVDNNKSILIDVREAYEYHSGTIENAINIPLSEISKDSEWFYQEIDCLINNTKNINNIDNIVNIIFFCRAGVRSMNTCMIYHDLITKTKKQQQVNIYNLSDGIVNLI